MSMLGVIVQRKREEVRRRRAHFRLLSAAAAHEPPARQPEAACVALRRAGGAAPRVIAEFKTRSPSAGQIRARRVGMVERIVREYETAGASAISVLCDGPGFGGTPLDLRRASQVTALPLLFKEFVLDEIQIELARLTGAHMVLLLARALQPRRLAQLVEATLSLGLAPVVEAADAAELEIALGTDSPIVGINARDLRTFQVDGAEAARLVELIPDDRVAVYMSGVACRPDFERVAHTRADAVLVGEALMRAASPGDKLREILNQG